MDADIDSQPISSETLEMLVAASLDAEPELLPHLPALMIDLEDLGARARDVLALLEGRGLGPGSRVLDLGCGKGASAIAVARAFGAQVKGVDGLPAFVEHARRRAGAEGLGERCTFEVGDVREAVLRADDQDLVMLLALGPVFGDARETVGVLRRCVRPGGLVLIDDAFLAEGQKLPEGAQDCFDHRTTVAFLEAHGDRLVGERLTDTEEAEAWCRAMTKEIVRRAQDLAEERPELAEALLEYAERQQRETEVLTGPLVGALWLLEIR
jgi:ubiquinone/menaquinone biosynthesis C-methylase UbiE